MPEILREWADMLKIPYDNNSELADILEASVPTITRWKLEQVRPTLHSLHKYDNLVKHYIQRMEKNASKA
jgi:hypothetical protein